MGPPNENVIYVAILAPSLALRTGLRSMLSSDERLVITADAATIAGLEGLLADSDVIVATQIPSRADMERLLPGMEVYPALLWLCDDPGGIQIVSELPVRAWGILPIDASAEEMTAAIYALHEGLLVAASHLLQPWLQAGWSHAEHLTAGSERITATNLLPAYSPAATNDLLTPRESEVLELLAQGLANKQIAVVLGISEHTVKFHVSSIYGKLGVGNRTEAVRAGARRGLILL